MIRRRIALTLAAFLFSFSPFNCVSSYSTGYAYDKNIELQDHLFLLPTSLQIIEDEAFEDTAVRTLILPDGFLFIGENAFRNVNTLENVYIPESTIQIGDTAFSSDASYTLYGITGSYAEEWAEEHDIPFEEENIWRHILLQDQQLRGNGLKIDVLLWTIDPFKPDKTEKDTQNNNRSYRVEDRPEFYPIDYRFP